MKKIDLETLKSFLIINKVPVLLEEIPDILLEDAVILSHDCDISLLNGHYEETDFVPPSWYDVLVEKCKEKRSLLIINQINSLSLEEQLKFVEILKYRKISTFKLPENCFIIVTASDLENHPLIEEIYTLVARI